MALMKVRILRGVTIADKPVFDREKGGDPPTFKYGDVVEVERVLAQELVGNGRAEFVSGDALVELAPYEQAAVKEEKQAAAKKRKSKAKRRKTLADKKEAEEEEAEETEEAEEEEPSAVTTAAFEPPEENAMKSRPVGRYR